MANRPLPPVLERWESDRESTRLLFWAANQAYEVGNRCLLFVANRRRTQILATLESDQDAGPTGHVAGQLDQLDAAIDRLKMADIQ
jgi:hypothetical protein